MINLCVAAKIKYFCSKIDDCEGDHAKLFQVACGLLYRKCKICLPTHTDPMDIAELFVHHFPIRLSEYEMNLMPKMPTGHPLSQQQTFLNHLCSTTSLPFRNKSSRGSSWEAIHNHAGSIQCLSTYSKPHCPSFCPLSSQLSIPALHRKSCQILSRLRQ